MSQELSDAEFLRDLVQNVTGSPKLGEAVYVTEADAERIRSIADRLERPGVQDGFTLSAVEFALLRQVFLHTGGTHIDMGSNCVEKANELRHAIYERTGRDFEVLT